MAQLIVNLKDNESMATALVIINAHMPEGEVQQYDPPVVTDTETPETDEFENLDLGMEEEVVEEVVVEEPDELEGLLGVDEPDAITVDDMKAGLQSLITAKGKDMAVGLVKKAFAKLGVKKMDEIPEEKREAFVNILKAACN